MKEETLTKGEALEAAQEYVGRVLSAPGLELVVLDERTLETDFGWVFFYDTREFAETGDDLARAVGNSPVIVDARTGRIEITGTAKPIDQYVELYRRHGTAHPK
jgi:Immunity protein 35